MRLSFDRDQGKPCRAVNQCWRYAGGIALDIAVSRSEQAIHSKQWGFASCLAGAALGAIGFLGWLVGREQLVTMIAGYPVMVPNTAVSLILLGLAGAWRRERPGQAVRLLLSGAAAVLVLLIGVGTLVEYGWKLQLGLDQLIISAPGGPFPGRPSPPTALALSFLATALLIFEIRPAARTRPSEWCAVGAGVIACTALLGQLFGAGPLFAFAGNMVAGMAVPTGLAVLMISCGLLLERPDAGLMRLVTSAGPGGVLLRRLAPAAVIAPVGFAILSLRLIRVADLSQIDFVLAAVTVFSILASLFLLAITASRLERAHETIARIQAETRALIDLASDAILVADAKGGYLDVNLAGHRMFGYTREELLRKTVMDLIPAEDLPRLEQQRQALLAGAVRINEWNVICKNGTLLPVEVSTRILPDGRWVAFIRDINERKRSDREQQFLLDLGLALPATLDFDQALSKVIDLSIRDLADICIADVCDNSTKLTRVKVACRDPSSSLCSGICHSPLTENEAREADILGRESPRLFKSLTTAAIASWDLNDQQVEALQEAGFRAALEIPLRARGHAMGRLVLIATRSRAFDFRDLPFAGAFGTVAALSLDNRRLYREAREASTARDLMLGYVAHDLRNPLQAIALNASVLAGGKGAAEASARAIQTATQRMNGLIQDLLDITRLESGQFRLKLERVPVSELVEDILDSQKLLAAAAQIDMTAAVPRFLPDLLADRNRILQVFENLIGNAIKFNNPGGSITLAAEVGAKEVVFSLADTGPGIAEADLAHLFDRFWQASKERRHGAGLGLAIVKGIVEAHGGRVWVTSTPGKGSTFCFSVPTAPTGADREVDAAGGSIRPVQTV